MTLLMLLLACDGGKDSMVTGDDTQAEIPQDCTAVSGNICTWAGTAGVAAFDGGGNHRLAS